MQPFTSILVDLDATAAAHPALHRAIEVARHYGAGLKLVDVIDVPPSAARLLPQGAEAAMFESRRTRLTELAAAADGLPVSVDVLRGRPAQALIAEVVSSGHDLVIRSHARDMVRPKAFGVTDMQLFRYCPCTVWAVGAGASTTPREVLAAVHASPADPQQQRLNARIIETAALMAATAGGRVTVLQAWHPFAEDMLRMHYSRDDMGVYVKSAADAARADLEALVAAHAGVLPGARVELRKGSPEEVVAEFVVAEGIDLVVMGTVARTGLAGLIMGNTAERLLQHPPCSLMAVKPEGFAVPGM